MSKPLKRTKSYNSASNAKVSRFDPVKPISQATGTNNNFVDSDDIRKKPREKPRSLGRASSNADHDVLVELRNIPKDGKRRENDTQEVPLLSPSKHKVFLASDQDASSFFQQPKDRKEKSSETELSTEKPEIKSSRKEKLDHVNKREKKKRSASHNSEQVASDEKKSSRREQKKRASSGNGLTEAGIFFYLLFFFEFEII